MRPKHSYLILLLMLPLLASCAGIRYMSIETREPAQVTLPKSIKSVLIVNNVVQQPDDIGHEVKKLGKRASDRTKASSDSIAIVYTEALAQFLGEEEYFDNVYYNQDPLRKDNNFWQERPLTPEKMIELRNESGADAVLSLDKLIMNTSRTDHFYQEGYIYGDLTGRVQSTIRVYLPTIDGQIPAVQFNDSLAWEGYDIQNGRVYTEFILPSNEDAMKELAIYAAEKMTKVFSPHWEYQDRWLYTSMNSKMREADVYANNNEWAEAITLWKANFESERKKINKAKAAHNIATGYEMLDDMPNALKWATTASDLMQEASSTNALEARRALLYKTEVARRLDNSNKINMQ